MINPSDIYAARNQKSSKASKWDRFHLDWWLLLGLIALSTVGLFILYSASNANASVVMKQGTRLIISFILMGIFAQIPPEKYKQWAPWFYGVIFFCF
jgi:Bacterial cell division membrane protein